MKQYTCTCVYLLCAVSTSVLHVCTQTISSCVSCACVSLLSLFQASLPSLQDFYSSIPTLPAGWANQTTTTPLDTIQLCKVSRAPCTASQPLVVTCCLTINSDLTWQVHIHGHTITPTARSPLLFLRNSLQFLLYLCLSCSILVEYVQVILMSNMRIWQRKRRGDFYRCKES